MKDKIVPLVGITLLGVVLSGLISVHYEFYWLNDNVLIPIAFTMLGVLIISVFASILMEK